LCCDSAEPREEVRIPNMKYDKPNSRLSMLSNINYFTGRLHFNRDISIVFGQASNTAIFGKAWTLELHPA
jgi:hypothetical protein